MNRDKERQTGNLDWNFIPKIMNKHEHLVDELKCMSGVLVFQWKRQTAIQWLFIVNWYFCHLTIRTERQKSHRKLRKIYYNKYVCKTNANANCGTKNRIKMDLHKQLLLPFLRFLQNLSYNACTPLITSNMRNSTSKKSENLLYPAIYGLYANMLESCVIVFYGVWCEQYTK